MFFQLELEQCVCSILVPHFWLLWSCFLLQRPIHPIHSPSSWWFQACVFFPFMGWWSLWSPTASMFQVVVESSGLSSEAAASLVTHYRQLAAQPEGAVLLAVMRGRCAEGADFKDDAARAVVVVGVPFPSMDTEVKLGSNWIFFLGGKDCFGMFWGDLRFCRTDWLTCWFHQGVLFEVWFFFMHHIIQLIYTVYIYIYIVIENDYFSPLPRFW